MFEWVLVFLTELSTMGNTDGVFLYLLGGVLLVQILLFCHPIHKETLELAGKTDGQAGCNTPKPGGRLPTSELRSTSTSCRNNCRKTNLLSGGFISLHSCAHLMLTQIQNRLENHCSEVVLVEFGLHEAVRNKKTPSFDWEAG